MNRQFPASVKPAPGQHLAKSSCNDCPVAARCALYAQITPSADAPLRQRLLRKGEYLFHERAVASALYVVRSGSLVTRMTSGQGGAMVPAFVLPGGIAGIDAFGEGHFSCDAVALEATNVCEIPISWLRRAAIEHPELQHAVLRLLSREIETLTTRMLRMGCFDAEERIASWLLDFDALSHSDPDGASTLALPMTRQDIGDHVGVALETVSRVFSDLQRKRMIEVGDHAVRLLDRSRLLSLSNAWPPTPGRSA